MPLESRVDGDNPTTDSGTGDSVFCWALGSIALRMGERLPIAQSSVEKGSFAQNPQAPYLTLPVSSSILRNMEELNLTSGKKVQPAKQDGWFPQLAVSSDQQKIFGSRPTGPKDLLIAMPSEDVLLGALHKQTTPVWSGYVSWGSRE